MPPAKIAILYIATGKYTVFWREFYESSERYFLNDPGFEKYYFVFTDADRIEFENGTNVVRIHQEQLGWPDVTLYRFRIFQKARKYLEQMDFVYFFNANMLFLAEVGKELLPASNQSLVCVRHPCFYDKHRSEYSYDENEESLAFVGKNEGVHYFMGGLNGGTSAAYLAMIDELERRVDVDRTHDVIALWHDESHLNRYAIDHADLVTVLECSYGYPEGWELPVTPKIIIRDKNNYGGHDLLRGKSKRFKKFFKKLFRC